MNDQDAQMFPFVDAQDSRLRLPGRTQLPAASPKYEDLPASTNIDDRRAANLANLIDQWRGFLGLSNMKQAVLHPWTALQGEDLPPGEAENSQLAQDAGLGSIGGNLLQYNGPLIRKIGE